jgi:hypothetical protein
MNIGHFRFILLVSLLLMIISTGGWANTTNAIHEEYSRADIYFAGWYWATDKRFSPEWTRKHYEAHFQLIDKDYVDQFIRWLNLSEKHYIDKAKIKSSTLPWLVIDLHERDGNMKTYYSDGCYLFSENGTVIHEVSNEFRKKFMIYSPIENSSPVAKRLTIHCE